MKHVNALSLACALAAAAAPVTASAVTERFALEACTNAALAQLPGFSTEVTSYRLDPNSERSERRLDRGGVFHIDLRDPESRDVVARVDCHYDRRAGIRELVSVPLTADDASLRAVQSF